MTQIADTAPSRARINLAAYAHNLAEVRKRIPDDCRIMAVVKANAYGHGAEPIARHALKHGATDLGVATVPEGMALREAGIEARILVMVQPSVDALDEALEHELELMISSAELVPTISAHAHALDRIAAIHMKLDTGMGRQGFEDDTAQPTAKRMGELGNVFLAGLATHFPTADVVEDTFTRRQLETFESWVRLLEKFDERTNTVHAANSAAIVNYGGAASFNMVRPGLMTYGVWPSQAPPEAPCLKPVLRWEADIAVLKVLGRGETVGYGRTYTASDAMTTAVLPVGYADGYPFALGNKGEVLIRGRRCSIRGRISMDQTVVDVTGVEGVAIGDTATLIGTDGDQTITAEDLAAWANTIPYDILTGIGPRTARIYAE